MNLWTARWASTVTAIILCATPLVIATLMLISSSHPVMAPDSASYLQWLPERTSPYPLFLRLVGVQAAVPVQLYAFAFSLCLLAWMAIRSFGRVAATALSLGIIANPQLWELQKSILSEALTTPLIVAFVASLLAFVARGRLMAIIAAGSVAGIAAIARPSLLPLVLIAPLTAYLVGGPQRHARALVSVLIFLFLAGANAIFTHAVHGPNTASLAGRHLFAKAALIDAGAGNIASQEPAERRAAAVADVGYAPVRAILKRVPAVTRRYLQGSYELCFQYTCTENALPNLASTPDRRDKLLFDVGMSRALRSPFAMLGLAADEYVSMWIFHPQSEESVVQAYRAFAARNGALPFQRELAEEGLWPGAMPDSRLERLFRVALIGVGILSLALTALFAALILKGRRELSVEVGFLSAVAVQATLVFDSFAGIGIPRYVMGLWPLIIVPIAMALPMVWSVRNRDRRASP